ncbi:MAG: putative enzyme related to lactoylglutathione lyase [Verrucomicrobiales bacterium]|jgi:predicted enzyme related to lactoylglutathione lyase
MSETKTGEFCWNELLTTDTSAAKTFYSELFGWEAEDMDMGDFTYTAFRAPGWGLLLFLLTHRARHSRSGKRKIVNRRKPFATSDAGLTPPVSEL